MADLDHEQEERIKSLSERYYDGDKSAIHSLFISERVKETLVTEKIYLPSLDVPTILGVLPYTPVVYSITCPLCVTRDNFSQFKSLVSAGLVVPVLLAQYAGYPQEVREFITSHDHIYSEEFDYFRGWSLGEMSDAETHAQGHDLIGAMISCVEGRRNDSQYRDLIDTFHENFFPYTSEDLLALQLALAACESRKLGQLKRIERLGHAIYQFRTAMALKAATVFKGADFNSLPKGISAETEIARNASENWAIMAAHGLGIQIPTELPIEAYIELVKDYQPRILQAVKAVVPSDEGPARSVYLAKNISDINREIDRLMRSRRFVAMEACLGWYRNNALLFGGAVVAAALGLAGSLSGCATTIALTAGAKLAKGKIGKNPPLARLSRMISRDLQPYTNSLMGKFLGGTPPAINVLSLRRRILNASQKS
jgi:hypothetical protein